MLRLLLFSPFLMVAVLVSTPLLIRLGLISPLGGLGMAVGAWIVGIGSGLVAGGIGAFRPDTRPLAWAALAVALFLAVGLGYMRTRVGGPGIHDITTDLVDPPQFVVAAEHPDNRGRDLAYPHGSAETPTLQRSAYPAVAGPIVATDATMDQVRERVIEVAEHLGWNVTWASAPEGLVEAEVRSSVFQFVDDVAIRIRPASDGFHVDLRSTSRVGRSDLGANAARILAFKRAWDE